MKNIFNLNLFIRKEVNLRDANSKDIKSKIEQDRKNERSSLTHKRIYEYNPNYLSDKKIFEAEFNDEDKINRIASNINRINKEQIKSVNLFEIKENSNEEMKYEKKIQKDPRHYEQYLFI